MEAATISASPLIPIPSDSKRHTCRHGDGVRVPVVDSKRESQSRVNEPRRIMGESSGNREQSGHLSKCNHHRVPGRVSMSWCKLQNTHTMMDMRMYDNHVPTGPAPTKACPDPRKRPVPIAPPSAIIARWRDLRLLCTAASPPELPDQTCQPNVSDIKAERRTRTIHDESVTLCDPVRSLLRVIVACRSRSDDGLTVVRVDLVLVLVGHDGGVCCLAKL
jgi:hypothetical protein